MRVLNEQVMIGIGNVDRGDDAVGRVVARLLRENEPCDLKIIEQTGGGMDLLGVLEEAEAVYVVDAARPVSRPGTIYRFDIAEAALSVTLTELSTHDFGAAATFELARTLDCLPLCCVVYAVEGVSFSPGDPLSPEIAIAATDVARLILDEISAKRG